MATIDFPFFFFYKCERKMQIMDLQVFRRKKCLRDFREMVIISPGGEFHYHNIIWYRIFWILTLEKAPDRPTKEKAFVISDQESN